MTAHATKFQFASALSDVPETRQALLSIVSQLNAQLCATPDAPASPVDLAVVFATMHHASNFPLIARVLNESLTPRVLLGATAEGVIGKLTEVESGPAISVLAARLGAGHEKSRRRAGVSIEPIALNLAGRDEPAITEDALRQMIPNESGDLRAVMLIADPYSTPMNRLLPMLNKTLPGLPIVGGMAGGRAPGENRLILNSEVHRAGAVGVALRGDLLADITVSQGCRPVGKSMVITKCQKHVVQELGGRNAMLGLKDTIESLTPEDRELVGSHGLWVGRVINEYKERFGRGDFLIRNLIGVDQERGWLAIGDPDIRVGQTIQFHLRDQRTAREDMQLLLETQKLHGSETPAGALLFSCNGRGTKLFDEPNADAGMIAEALGNMPLAGFFCAGEIGPVGDQNFLHGHTASLLVLRPGV